ELVAEALVDDGHRVTQAADAIEALGCMTGRGFDLMITDLRMPGEIDGVDLVRRARSERPEMEVIGLTAHGTVTTAAQAMKLGVFDSVEKPLGSPGQLRALVRRGLTGNGRSGELDPRKQPRPSPIASGEPLRRLGDEVGQALGPDYRIGEVIGRG